MYFKLVFLVLYYSKFCIYNIYIFSEKINRYCEKMYFYVQLIIQQFGTIIKENRKKNFIIYYFFESKRKISQLLLKAKKINYETGSLKKRRK